VAPRTKDRPFDEFRIVRTAIVGTA
jgi:hypothetical protein